MPSEYEGKSDPRQHDFGEGLPWTPTRPPNDYGRTAAAPSETDHDADAALARVEVLPPADENRFDDGVQPRLLDLAPGVDRLSKQLRALQQNSPLFLGRLQRLAPLRDEALLQRNHARFVWGNCQSYRNFVSESQNAFLQEADAILALLERDDLADKLRGCHATVREDYNRQKGYAENVIEMEMQLEETESRMQELERKVAESARIVNDLLAQIALPQDSAPATVTATITSSASSAKQSVDVHPLVQHYLDKFGDWKNERDKLFDLDQEHQEQKALRQFFLDQGLEPETVDKDFEQHWLQVFTEAEVAFVEAKEKTELALKICQGEGLDPESYRKAAFRTSQEYTNSPQPGSTSGAPATPASFVREVSSGPRPPAAQLRSPQNTAPFPNVQNTEADLPSPSSQRHLQLGSPHLARVADWVESLQPEQSDARSMSTSDLQSLSSTAAFDPSRRNSSRSQSSRIKKYHRSLASYLAGWVEDEDGEQRPAFIKRSSSESEMMILKSIPGTHDRVLLGFQRASSPLRQLSQSAEQLAEEEADRSDTRLFEAAASNAQSM